MGEKIGELVKPVGRVDSVFKLGNLPDKSKNRYMPNNKTKESDSETRPLKKGSTFETKI